MKKNNPSDAGENPEEEYIGNIWGWKFSFISLGIIVAMLLLMWYRYSIINTYIPETDKQTITTEKDSSNLEFQSND